MWLLGESTAGFANSHVQRQPEFMWLALFVESVLPPHIVRDNSCIIWYYFISGALFLRCSLFSDVLSGSREPWFLRIGFWGDKAPSLPWIASIFAYRCPWSTITLVTQTPAGAVDISHTDLMPISKRLKMTFLLRRATEPVPIHYETVAVGGKEAGC